MEKMSPQSQRSPSTVPLARDPDGNPIELPDGAIGWRIRRQTGGRPRLLLDSKKQPMLFPLDYTVADVEDILPPGNYLLDVIDKGGEPLGVTIGLALGTLRNAESIEPDNENNAPSVVPTALPTTTSEVRLVLEANVRATQMAFLHNQRTLEIGLRMAETLRDSVQVLASAQADWIKSVSSARGFFRSTTQPLPPVEVKQLTVHTNGEADDEDDSDEDDGDEAHHDMASRATDASAHWSAPFVPLIHSVVQQVGPAVMAWAAKQQAGGSTGASGHEGGSDAQRPGWEMRDLVDWRYAHQKQAAYREKQAAEKQAAEKVMRDQDAQDGGTTDHAAQLTAAIAAAWSPGSGLNVVKLLQLLPSRTVTKFTQLQAALAPDEQSDAMQIFRSHGPAGMEELLRVFDAASLEQSADFLRRLIGEWRAKRSALAPAATNGGSISGASGDGSTTPG